MELRKSKVVGATPNGTWESQYGLFYKFEIAMENGDVGEYSSKYQDQTKFKVGEETDYEKHTINRNGKQYIRIKPVSNFEGGGQSFQGGSSPRGVSNPDREVTIIRQTALKICGELVVAGTISMDEMTAVADQLVDFVQTGEVKAIQRTPTESPF